MEKDVVGLFCLKNSNNHQTMKKTEWNFKGKGNTKRKKNSIKNEYKTCATKNCAVNNTHTKLERISVTPESHLEFFKNLISHFRLTSSVFILFYLFVSTLDAWCAAHFYLVCSIYLIFDDFMRSWPGAHNTILHMCDSVTIMALKRG